jgi:hypothetical protein
VETKSGFMMVKVRFGRGPLVARRKGKNSRMAMLGSTFLTLVAITCGSMGMWRVGYDLNYAGAFVFQDGLLSHWQVWLAAAVGAQYSGWQLTRYARRARRREVEVARAAEKSSNVRAAANV